jgi:hypothetical protein
MGMPSSLRLKLQNGLPQLFLSLTLHLMINLLWKSPAHCCAFQRQMVWTKTGWSKILAPTPIGHRVKKKRYNWNITKHTFLRYTPGNIDSTCHTTYNMKKSWPDTCINRFNVQNEAGEHISFQFQIKPDGFSRRTKKQESWECTRTKSYTKNIVDRRSSLKTPQMKELADGCLLQRKHSKTKRNDDGEVQQTFEIRHKCTGWLEKSPILCKLFVENSVKLTSKYNCVCPTVNVKVKSSLYTS